MSSKKQTFLQSMHDLAIRRVEDASATVSTWPTDSNKDAGLVLDLDGTASDIEALTSAKWLTSCTGPTNDLIQAV